MDKKTLKKNILVRLEVIGGMTINFLVREVAEEGYFGIIDSGEAKTVWVPLSDIVRALSFYDDNIFHVVYKVNGETREMDGEIIGVSEDFIKIKVGREARIISNNELQSFVIV